MTRFFLLWIGVGVLLLGDPAFAQRRKRDKDAPAPATTPVATPEAKRPNIVLIMAHGLGFSDLGCYGGETRTMNLDKLGYHGVRYSQFYGAGNADQTHARLLTGLYPYAPCDNCRVMPTPTFPQLLSKAGYRTYGVGLWLAHNETRAIVPQFDQTLSVTPTNNLKLGDRDLNKGKPVQNLTATLADTAASWARKATRAQAPFLLCLSFPKENFEKVDTKLATKYASGPKATAEARQKTQQQLGLFEKPLLAAVDSSMNVPAPVQPMAAHAAYLMQVDQGVGRIVSGLAEAGALENTVIVFLSIPDSLHPGKAPVKATDKSTASSSTHRSIAWQQACNTPFLQSSGGAREGDLVVPLIIHYPKAITQPNQRIHQMAHVIDVVPTLLALAGGKSDRELDGVNLLPLDGIKSGRTLYWHTARGRAIRQGNWKLVSYDNGPWRLYDLASDRTERRDLSANNAAKVDGLKQRYNDWAREHGYPFEKTIIHSEE